MGREIFVFQVFYPDFGKPFLPVMRTFDIDQEDKTGNRNDSLKFVFVSAKGYYGLCFKIKRKFLDNFYQIEIEEDFKEIDSISRMPISFVLKIASRRLLIIRIV